MFQKSKVFFIDERKYIIIIIAEKKGIKSQTCTMQVKISAAIFKAIYCLHSFRLPLLLKWLSGRHDISSLGTQLFRDLDSRTHVDRALHCKIDPLASSKLLSRQMPRRYKQSIQMRFSGCRSDIESSTEINLLASGLDPPFLSVVSCEESCHSSQSRHN